MKLTGRITIEASEVERLDNEMETLIKENRKLLSKLDYQLNNSEMRGNRKNEIYKSMINFLVEQL